jgi:hypothetical protein
VIAITTPKFVRVNKIAPYRRWIALSLADSPTATVKSRSAASNHRMNVAVRVELLIPRVQNHERRGIITLLITNRLLQRRPGRRKQQIVDLFAIPKCQPRQITRQCEDNLEVVDTVKDQFVGRLDPVGPLGATASGAVTVAT